MFYFKRTSPCLIGWESSASFLHQSQSEARKTKQSRNTCHTQLKVAVNKQSDVSSPLQSCYSDEPDGLQWLLRRRVSRWPIWWWKEKEWKIKDMISYFSWLHAYIDYFIRRPIYHTWCFDIWSRYDAHESFVQGQATSFPRSSLFLLRKRTLVAAGHVTMQRTPQGWWVLDLI